MVAPFIRGIQRFVNPATGGINVLRNAAGELIFDPRAYGPFLPKFPPAGPVTTGARRSPGFSEFVEQPEFESLFSPSLPFVGPATPSAGRSFPSAIVEPGNALPGVRRARPVLDPQDVQFVNPRLTPPPPAFPLSRQTIPYAIEPPARPYVASGFETRISPSRVEGFDVPEYTPLQPAQIMQVNEAAAADPIGTVAQSIEILDSAADAQQFGRSLEIASIARSRLGTSEEAFLFNQMLDDAVRRNARRFGIDENDIDPILYTNSRQLPDERAAESFGSRGERQDWAAARTDSEKFETDTRKVIKETRRVDDLDDLDTRNNGAIYRALAAGEINAEQAKRLIDQVNYRRVRLLQDKGTLPKNIKNNTKDKEGVRGIGLLVPSVLRGSDAQKAAIYKAAIQTSESSEELAQVYSIARADVTSPEYLDVIEDALNAKTSILGQIEGVSAPRLPSVGRSTIDEGSVVSANRAAMQDEARRALDDETRPAFPSDDIDPEETISRRLVTNPETGKLEEAVEGGATSRMIDRSLSSPPEPPSVSPGQGGMTPLNPRNSGPGAYNSRTVDNAQQADITISIAANRATGGEILTERAALGGAGVRRGVNKRGQEAWVSDYGSDGQYGRVTRIEKIDHLSADIDSHADSIVAQLNRVAATQGRPVIINGAGNGLASLPSQAEADAFARHLIKRIVENPSRSFDIDYLVTGGQNGYDIALAKAAKAYGIRVRINPAYTSRGSIMLQDPDDIENMIFMSPQEYVRNHRLDTAEVGATYGKTQTSAKASTTSSWSGGQTSRRLSSSEKFEVSSAGDKRFSAGFAEIDGRPIEDIYQVDIKGGVKTGRGRFAYSTKGNPPAPGSPAASMTQDEQYQAYKQLWVRFFDENPELLDEVAELSRGKILTDQYGSGAINQARAIDDILTERGLR